MLDAGSSSNYVVSIMMVGKRMAYYLHRSQRVPIGHSALAAQAELYCWTPAEVAEWHWLSPAVQAELEWLVLAERAVFH